MTFVPWCLSQRSSFYHDKFCHFFFSHGRDQLICNSALIGWSPKRVQSTLDSKQPEPINIMQAGGITKYCRRDVCRTSMQIEAVEETKFILLILLLFLFKSTLLLVFLLFCWYNVSFANTYIHTFPFGLPETSSWGTVHATNCYQSHWQPSVWQETSGRSVHHPVAGGVLVQPRAARSSGGRGGGGWMDT